MVSYEKSTQIIYKPLVYIPDLPFVMTKDPYALPSLEPPSILSGRPSRSVNRLERA
jgi:hypothetical protein